MNHYSEGAQGIPSSLRGGLHNAEKLRDMTHAMRVSEVAPQPSLPSICDGIVNTLADVDRALDRLRGANTRLTGCVVSEDCRKESGGHTEAPSLEQRMHQISNTVNGLASRLEDEVTRLERAV